MDTLITWVPRASWLGSPLIPDGLPTGTLIIMGTLGSPNEHPKDPNWAPKASQKGTRCTPNGDLNWMGALAGCFKDPSWAPQ